jgi:hypothetical protein
LLAICARRSASRSSMPRTPAASMSGADLALAQPAGLDEPLVAEEHALLGQRGRGRRHRAGRRAADVGVVPRFATRKASCPRRKTGVITVRSGRWLPPL